MNILQDIGNAKHILIIATNSNVANSSALYTYILTLHKKVSLVCEYEDLDDKFSFLPWFDKVKFINNSSSADLKINLDLSTLDLYELFKKANIKPNQKMATSLYAGLIEETNGFTNDALNSTTFAVAKELIELKAEFKKCNEYILKRSSLSLLRLKAIMFKSMTLNKNASLATLYIDDNILKATGASIKESYLVMDEALLIPLVKNVQLKKVDENNKIIKTIKKEC